MNVGSNTQPSLSHDPQTVAIAVEPMVGCRIREQRNLHVLHAAVAANNTLAFMQWYNKFGESSSLGTATEKAEYTTRYRGKRKIVNVISLTTLVESIPLTVKLWYLKTDMQGFDFDALRSAADVLRSGRAQYVMSEVWWDRYQSYAGQNNDFCLHQYPLMRALGYELVDVENGYQSNKYHGIERLKTLDTKRNKVPRRDFEDVFHASRRAGEKREVQRGRRLLEARFGHAAAAAVARADGESQDGGGSCG